MKVDLDLSTLLNPKDAATVEAYDQPTMRFSGLMATIESRDGLNAMSFHVPDNGYIWDEYKRGWNAALRLAASMPGQDLQRMMKS